LNPLIDRGEKYDEWIVKTIKQIKKITNKKVKIRLHPRFQSKYDVTELSKVADSVSQNYDGWNKSNG